VRTLLACCAVLAGACGGAVAEERSAEPLPSEFPFEYLRVFLTGSGVLGDGETPSFTAKFEAGSDDRSGGLYPVQYGIGYFFPAAGELRIEITDCSAEDLGFYDAICAARLTEWNLTVASRADHPHPFMDEADPPPAPHIAPPSSPPTISQSKRSPCTRKPAPVLRRVDTKARSAPPWAKCWTSEQT
jgi:hypothetical protein